MKYKGFLFSLIGIFLTFTSYAQIYERVALEDAFGNDASGQSDVIQGNGVGGNLYIKGVAAGSGIRESFFKLSLEDMDNLTSEELDYTKVELRIYTVRSNTDAGQNQIGVYPISNDWSETTLTWTNSRDLSAAGITEGVIATGAGTRVAGYTGTGQQGQPTDAYNASNESRFDISAYAIEQYKAGNKTISVMLHVNNTVNNGDQQLGSKDLPDDSTIPERELKMPKVIVTTPVPSANFTVSSFGFENLPVTFTNTSALPTSYVWDFGDGGTSTEANPIHTYTAAGDYVVTLTINGDAELVKSQNVHIYQVANKTILGGDMEEADRAFFVELGAENLIGGTNDQLVWGTVAGTGSSSYKPSGFGTGGFLTVAEDYSASTSYILAQAVYLEGGKIYSLSFDYHVNNYSRAWWNIYIGTTVPSTNDYSDNQVGSLIDWSTTNVAPNTKDIFAQNFIPETSGIYFVVLKWGCGAGANGYFNTSMDNLSLKEVPVLTTVSVEDISIKEGEESAVNVTFTDQFGEPVDAAITGIVSDPATGLSIDNREGTYYVTGVVAGTYTITVVAQAGEVTQTGQATVKVDPVTGIDSVNGKSISISQTNNEICISKEMINIQLYSIQGQRLLNVCNTNSINISTLAKGVYVLQIMDDKGVQSAHKIVIH